MFVSGRALAPGIYEQHRRLAPKPLTERIVRQNARFADKPGAVQLESLTCGLGRRPDHCHATGGDGRGDQ